MFICCSINIYREAINLCVYAKPSEEFGNDERVEALWAMKAYEHAEVYFNILCSVDPAQIPRLSPCDDEIYTAFRKEFPDMKVELLVEMRDLKSDTMKKRWRAFCEEMKHVEDYSFATLMRLDSKGEYEEANPRIPQNHRNCVPFTTFVKVSNC